MMGEQVPVKQEEDTKPKRFVEKGPQVIYDTKTKVFWMKKDSWQDKGKFFNWHESRDYSDKKNMRKIGGYSDWRLPSIDEAASLYSEEFENKAKGGSTIHIDAVFPEGGFKNIWLMGDTSTRRPRYDYVEGQVTGADEYAFGATRLCRKESAVRDHTRPPVRN
jgi:hypothetical protein